MKTTQRRKRRGTLYLTVLSVTLIVSMIGMASLHVARLQLRTVESGNSRENARLLAISAIEHALSEFNTNPNWQTTYNFDQEYPIASTEINGGEFRWILRDMGGQRAVHGIGRSGPAECRFEVLLESAGSSSTLDRGLLVGGDLTLLSGLEELTILDSPLKVNATVNNSGTINGDVEADTINNWGTITGSETAGVPVANLPDPNAVFDYYVTAGTTIPYASLFDGFGYSIKDVLLSPANNPYGATNAQGIYVVDCQGGGVSIEDCRIVGTLVFLNASSDVKIKKSVNWEPALPNYPALLVDGTLNSRLNSSIPVSESQIGTNLNPASTPYNGNSDSDTNDQYPSAVAGLIYVDGMLEFGSTGNSHVPHSFEGILIASGNCQLLQNTNPVITYDPVFNNSPPPGFGGGDPSQIVPGTWKQISSN